MTDPDLLAAAKARFQKKLEVIGLDATEQFIVARPRKSRPKMVGYYSHHSQFRGRPRFVVDIEAIRSSLAEVDELNDGAVNRETFRTLASLYGHRLVEAIAHVRQCGDTFNVPSWQDAFKGDANEFAEDFARYADGDVFSEDVFWTAFLPAYRKEADRLFTAVA